MIILHIIHARICDCCNIHNDTAYLYFDYIICRKGFIGYNQYNKTLNNILTDLNININL